MTTFGRSLFIFRRDLRVTDNTALLEATTSSREVLACFIFNDAQVGNHPFRSMNALSFMIESLAEVAREIRARGGTLYLFHGRHDEIVDRLIETDGVEAVFFNRDYTPFSRTRDAAIEAVCARRAVPVRSMSDALLVEPASFGKDDGRPYTVYTPFFKRASKESIPRPAAEPSRFNFVTGEIRCPVVSLDNFATDGTAPHRVSHGGRSSALAILEGMGKFTHYKDERDQPALRGTTLLSPHNKFGTVSIREVYRRVAEVLGAEHTLIRELFWRDFFTHIAWHFPHVFEGCFHREYDALQWENDPRLFEAWCTGRTGFPIVDAGMRELVDTGYMHNRVRMITASFLVKDLHIDWRWGERFFAQHLTEYDPAVNNGSWQWSASTGCDAQPYFRIFNPWLQQARFDESCEYVKRWIPELSLVAPKEIHKIAETPLFTPANYPRPIVDHSERKGVAERMFSELKKG